MNEWQEQRVAIKWFRETYPEHAQCIRLSLTGVNLGGSKRAAIMINQMKAQGLVLGESDLCLAIPKGGYGCLMIEHKSKDDKNGPTQAQRDYADYHNRLGNRAVFTKGIEDLKSIIQSYMEEL